MTVVRKTCLMFQLHQQVFYETKFISRSTFRAPYSTMLNFTLFLRKSNDMPMGKKQKTFPLKTASKKISDETTIAYIVALYVEDLSFYFHMSCIEKYKF